MRRTALLVISFILVMIIVLVYLYSEGGRYATFQEASHTPKTVHVIATVIKATIKYNPHENPDLTFFYAVDNEGGEKPVVLMRAPPPDLAFSDKIVLIGKWQDTFFVAQDVLLKCPSKYKESS